MLGIVTYSALYAHVAPPILTDVAPSWSALRATAAATPTGKRLARDLADPRGPPHAGASLRLFDAADESDVRVTLYRDSAAWCPYCQKAWLFLEEKRIPYRVERVPLNAYGYKPQWYSRKVDGGKLPALELDGAQDDAARGVASPGTPVPSAASAASPAAASGISAVRRSCYSRRYTSHTGEKKTSTLH